MSIWQSPYRAPPIRSRAVVRPHRSGASGDVAGQPLQPISPPDIIPLQRGFWAAYGKQTAACMVGFVVSLFYLWISWGGDEGPAYTWLSGGVAAVMLLIPFFFYSRWRKMESIFGEEMYDSTEGDADLKSGPASDSRNQVSSEALLRLHPNRGQLLDGTQVGLTALLLVCTAAVQGFVGSMILFVASPAETITGPAAWKVFAVGLLIQAAVNLWFVVATLRHRVGAPRLALYVSLVGVLLSMGTVHAYAIAACATCAGVLWRSHMAFQMMLARVAEPEKKDPLEAYYHNLLQLLVWVMRADGHADRRELRKINTTCNAMNLSAWERDVVIASANLEDRKDLRTAAERYLVAAQETSIADAGNALVVVASAVAGADGVIAKNEADAVRELAKLVGVTESQSGQILLQQQLHIETLDAPRAHELLHLEQGASEAQVQEAHRTLTDELSRTHYQHIGTSLDEQIRQRHTMLDRARDLLLKEATA